MTAVDRLRSHGQAKAGLLARVLDAVERPFLPGGAAAAPPVPATRPDAAAHLQRLATQQWILPVVRDPVERKQLQPAPVKAATTAHSFDEEAFYVWVYEGSPVRTYLLSGLCLLVALAAVMVPMWPAAAHTGLYYLSYGAGGLLALLVVITIVRAVLYVTTRATMGGGGTTGLWLYPNLYADVGFFDSFRPTWEWGTADAVSASKDETDGPTDPTNSDETLTQG